MLAFGFATYFGVFRLPFYFPPQRQLWSASYAFGFNNGVAIVVVAGLIGVLTLGRIWARGEGDGLPLRPISGKIANSWGMKWTLLLAIGSYAVATVLLAFYYQHSSPSIMWEPRHFLYRTWLIDLYGRRPYTEFSAEYGPVLTYAPWWLYLLLRNLTASYEGAYFFTHFLLNVTGLLCIYYVLTRTQMPTKARVAIFAVLALAGFAVYMGLNGVLLRYLLPFVGLVISARYLARFSEPPTIREVIYLAVLGSFFNVGAVLLSPEIALASVVAWFCYSVFLFKVSWRLSVAALVAVAVSLGSAWLSMPSSYFVSLVRFTEGANNLPVLPAAHIILFLITIFWAIPPLLATPFSSGDRRQRSLNASLGALCVAMAPGALGRCDPPHVLFYGMGTSLLLMIILSNRSWRNFSIYVTAYAVVLIGLLELINLRVFYGVTPRELLSLHVVSTLGRAAHRARTGYRASTATLAKLNKYHQLGMPFGTFGDPTVERYVAVQGLLQPEYYMAVVGVYSQAALERKLADVASEEYVLIPDEFLDRPSQNLCQQYNVSLRRWFFYPARLRCRAEPLDPVETLSRFVRTHYSEVERIDHSVVMRRK